MIVGGKYYIAAHAYHHFLGEMVEILGPRRVVLNNVSRVYSCARDWTSFFAEGAKKDTTCTYWPDGMEIDGYLFVVPWHHELPRGQKK